MALMFSVRNGHGFARAAGNTLQETCERFVAARRLEARRRTGQPLQWREEVQLSTLGYSDADIEAMQTD